MKTLNLGLVFIALTVLMFASVHPICAQSGTWTNGAAISDLTYGLGGAFVGGKFYAIAGNSAALRIYNPTNNSWTSGTPAPSSIQYFGVAVLDEKIYVVGGYSGSDRATLYCYNPASNTWSTLAPMPLGARAGLGAAALNGKIYAVGGFSGGISTNRVEVYDPAVNTWTTKASMPTAHGFALVGTISGKLYVAGGQDSSGYITATHVYDPNVNAWSTNAPMPFTDGNGVGVVLNGRLYSIGAGPSPERRVFAYDPAWNSWSTNFALMPTGRHAHGVAADEANNKIYVVGGYANSSYILTLEIFTPPLPSVLLTNIVVSPASPIIAAGSNQQFTATGYYGDGSSGGLNSTNGLVWGSSNQSVATIDTNGIATGLTNGVTSISATSGSVSNGTALTVVVVPTIATNPVSATVSPGGTVTLSVSANGGVLSYQWQCNGTNIAGATGATLTITNVSAPNIGVYTVIVNNVAGSVTSMDVTLASMDIKLFAGIIVNGPLGSNYLIKATSDLSGSNWTTLTNVALPTQPYIFIDYNSPSNSRQFYRAVPQ